MGAVSMDHYIPEWMVGAGCMLLILMAAAMCCGIARDIAEMRVLWRAVENGQKRAELEIEQKKRELRRRKKHGVNLEETRLVRCVDASADDQSAGI